MSSGAKITNRNLERSALKLVTTGSNPGRKLLAQMDESFFGNPINLAIYKRIISTVKRKGEIPSWRGLKYDTSLPDAAREVIASFKEKPVLTKERGVEIFDQMFVYRRRRLLDKIARHVNEKQLAGSYDDAALVEEVSDFITQARTKSDEEKPLAFGKGSNYKPVLEKVLSGKALPTMPTGFPAWDTVNGGIIAKTVTLISGFTGSMKSTLAEVLACNFADTGARVGIASLEMSQEETVILRAARLARIDRTEILKATGLTQKQRDKIEKVLYIKDKKWRKTGATVKTHTPKRGMSADEFFLTMETYGYHVVILDYISLLRDIMKGNNFWQNLMEFTARAKQFANDTNSRVIILVQATKDNELKLSSNMLNDADLWWAIEYNSDNDAEHMKIGCPKARKQKPVDFILKREGVYANIEHEPNQSLMKSMGKMEVKNKNEKFKSADTGNGNISTRTSKRQNDDEDLIELFEDVSLS